MHRNAQATRRRPYVRVHFRFVLSNVSRGVSAGTNTTRPVGAGTRILMELCRSEWFEEAQASVQGL